MAPPKGAGRGGGGWGTAPFPPPPAGLPPGMPPQGMPPYYGWYGPMGPGPWPGGPGGGGVTAPPWPQYGGEAAGKGTGKGGGRGKGGQGWRSDGDQEWECRVCRTPNRQHRDRCRRCGDYRDEGDGRSPTILPEDHRAPAGGTATPLAPAPPPDPAPGPAPGPDPPAFPPAPPAHAAMAGAGPGHGAGVGTVDDMTADGETPAPRPGAGGHPEPGAAGAAGAGDARQQLTKEQKDQLHCLKQKRAKLKKAAAELSGSACGTAIKEDLERTQREIDKLDPRPIGVRLTKTEEALDKLVRQREHLKGIIRSTEDDKAKAEKQLEKLNAEEIGLLETKEQLREQLALHTVPGLVERERERAEQRAREAAELGAATEA